MTYILTVSTSLYFHRVQNSTKSKPSTKSISSVPASGGFLSDEDSHDGHSIQNSAVQASTMLSTKPFDDDHMCNSDPKHELPVKQVYIEPIYIDSDASNDSTGSHVFDREIEDSFSKSRSDTSKKKLICKDGQLQISTSEDVVVKAGIESSSDDMYQALRDQNHHGLNMDDSDSERFYNNDNHFVVSPKFTHDSRSDENGARDTKSKVTDHVNISEQFDRFGRKAKKLHTKQKSNAQGVGKTVSRKRPVFEMSDSTDDIDDVPGQESETFPKPKTKRTLYDQLSAIDGDDLEQESETLPKLKTHKGTLYDTLSARIKKQNVAAAARGKPHQASCKDGKTSQDNGQYSPSSVGWRKLSEESSSKPKADMLDVDIVDLCGEEEEDEEEEEQINNESLFDVIGDIR